MRIVRRAAATACVFSIAISLLAGSVGHSATAPPFDPATYCAPGNRAADPPDVPPGGSQIVTPPGVTARRIEVDGLHTSVLEAGPQTAHEAVVFFHGNPGSSQDFSQLLALVGRFARAIAFDLPGFGHADKPFRFDPAQLYPRFVGDVLAALHVTRVDVVIHDLGAIGALGWALRHPSEVGSFVVLDSGLPIGYRPYPLARTWATPSVGEEFQAVTTRAAFVATIESNANPRGLPLAFVNRMYDDYDRGTRCAILRIYRTLDFAALARAEAPAVRAHPHPTLVLWGAADPYLPVSLAAEQRTGFPGAHIVVFKDSGHWPFIDDPARADPLIVGFLRTVVGRPTPIVLAVRPGALQTGRATRVELRVSARTGSADEPLAGAEVEVGGETVVSNRQGLANVTLRPAAPGAVAVSAREGGYRTGRSTIVVS